MEESGGERVAADAATARAWLEVDVSAVRRNAVALASCLGPGTRLLPMVKADAYGLGAVRVARTLAPEKPWGLGVATVEEGAELRRAGIEDRIVVFTPCAPIDAPRLLEWSLEPVATSLEALVAYAAAAKGDGRLRVHLEVDTGMGRFGLPAERSAEWAPEVRATLEAGDLELASTFTHFHSAESDPGATRNQWERFETALGHLRAAGAEPGLRHAANSAALLLHPEVQADLVRPGLFLYGGEAFPCPVPQNGPSTPVSGSPERPRPEAVAHVRARVLDVRYVPAGATVSYGATFTTRRRSRLATLGIGYADGLPHALSNRGEALVAGRRVPIVGSVCMDMTVVDVTGVDGVRPGIAATLLGPDGADEIGLGELARRSGRIPYEVLTSFSGRLPRIEIVGATARRAGEEPTATSGGRTTNGSRAMESSESSRPDELVRLAHRAMERAYAPYSRFRVGAALETADGSRHTGCNVENASYPVTTCAERMAIGAAIVAGAREFRRLAICASGEQPASPCGMCRQALVEFGLDLEIVSVTPDGKHARWRLRDLLPNHFALGSPLEAVEPEEDGGGTSS